MNRYTGIGKIKEQFLKFMRQGMSAEKLSFTLAIGMGLGIFPVIGVTTGVCIAAAMAFRLNQAALQLVNYLAYPIQIFCIIPFYELGAYLFSDTEFTLSFRELKARVEHDLYATLMELWGATWHAMVAWFLVAPCLMAVVYYTVLSVLKKIEMKRSGLKAKKL